MERVSAVKCKHGVSPDGMKAEVVPSGFPRASRHKACKREPADIEWNPSSVAGSCVISVLTAYLQEG